MRWNDIIAISIFIIAFILSLALGLVDSDEPSRRTRQLCKEYAQRDHEKEFTQTRWDWLQTYGNPNDEEFFYQSCIGHVTGEPANKEYMK